jgi:UDP-N-acetylglucosamine 2-epimerase (non-hydrolysing)
MKILTIAGARPNFMKIGPVVRAIRNKDEQLRRAGSPHRLTALLVHTGQHYDDPMSDVFFRDLRIPAPDINLGVGSGSHAEQTGRVMIELEKVCIQESPDLAVVVGDVNSTLAGALVAAKLRIPLAHVEAGLRSFDRSMPEEINRILTDAVSDLLFITEPSAEVNLIREGIQPDRICFAGNVMIDTLRLLIDSIDRTAVLARFGLRKADYVAVTLHRPAGVDVPENLRNLIHVLSEVQKSIRIVFPVHPRTRVRMAADGFADRIAAMPNLLLTEPLGYLDFIALLAEAKFVMTDSGGIQEETTVLGIPCLTLRDTTERPITVAQGTNEVVGLDPSNILTHCEKILAGDWKKGRIPELWDGKAAERIVDRICNHLG